MSTTTTPTMQVDGDYTAVTWWYGGRMRARKRNAAAKAGPTRFVFNRWDFR